MRCERVVAAVRAVRRSVKARCVACGIYCICCGWVCLAQNICGILYRPPAAPHQTAHHIHQVREQPMTHALDVRRSEERVNSPRQRDAGVSWAECTSAAGCCTSHTASNASAPPRMVIREVLLLIRALFPCSPCSLVHGGSGACSAATGRSLLPCRFSRVQ